ncbi:MAG: hypothetical protein G01um101419_750 [Parcubacteria group bacterium Gr01-1014_19]|nr:MAG: hypothetical protein G01um101419_750 [Parcubacteria group bacterium Gr01-1014_19]
MPKPKMTADQFMKELAKHKGKFKIGIHHYYDKIRISLNGELDHCPVTSVCETLTGKRFGIGQWKQAAREIGLQLRTANAIVRAADDELRTKTAKLYRRQMFRVLGLKEKVV